MDDKNTNETAAIEFLAEYNEKYIKLLNEYLHTGQLKLQDQYHLQKCRKSTGYSWSLNVYSLTVTEVTQCSAQCSKGVKLKNLNFLILMLQNKVLVVPDCLVLKV